MPVQNLRTVPRIEDKTEIKKEHLAELGRLFLRDFDYQMISPIRQVWPQLLAAVAPTPHALDRCPKN